MRPTFRGGGSFKKPIFENLKDAFGTEPFTYANAAARVDGFNRSVCSSFRDDEWLLKVTTTSPCYYRISQAGTTRVRTKQEKIALMFRRRGVSRFWKYVEPRLTLNIETVISLFSERLVSTNKGFLSTALKRYKAGECLNYISAISSIYKAAWVRL
jgi:hypothetical protein